MMHPPRRDREDVGRLREQELLLGDFEEAQTATPELLPERGRHERGMGDGEIDIDGADQTEQVETGAPAR